MTKAESVSFALTGLTLSGKRWGKRGGLPVIALHGWLDNAGSFDFLAPQLAELDIVALDLAGHGLSDHRPLASAYNIWLDIAEVLSVAEQLGWSSFGLLGHSRGAMIATLLAATFPHKVTHLAVIEAFVPQPVAATEAPAQLASAITLIKNLASKPRRIYPTLEDAVSARRRGMTELSLADADVLADRGVESLEQGYRWRNDYKLMAPSEVKFTAEQVAAFVARLALDVLIIGGDQGMLHHFHPLDDWLQQYPNLHRVELKGDHHLHMSRNCQDVALHCKTYFKNKDRY